MSTSRYSIPPLARTCVNCQRCARHSFDDDDCRMALHREACLTCSNDVFFIAGVDLSREGANGQVKTPAKSRGSKKPNRAIRAFAPTSTPNPVPTPKEGRKTIREVV
jgi:hypothetical protein